MNTHFVRLENSGNLLVEGVVWVGMGEERYDFSQHLAYLKCRAPVGPQYVEVDQAFWVNVGVVYGRHERHLQSQNNLKLIELENMRLAREDDIHVLLYHDMT